MSTSVQKNFIKEMIEENQFRNAGDTYGYFKDLFKGTIQEMLEAKLAVSISIGYPKNEKLIETHNERNGHSQKPVKSQLGEVEPDISRERKGDFEPIVVHKYKNHFLYFFFWYSI